MPLVVTCTTCGLVNEGWVRQCSDCGAKLSPLRFYRPHLRPGMREKITRLSSSLRVMRRPPGTEVRTSDGEVFFIRRRWTSRGLPLPEPDADDLQDEAVEVATEWGFGAYRAEAGVALLVYPLLLLVSVVARTLRWLDHLGRAGFEVIGHFVFLRPWVIQIYRGNPARVYRTFRVRGYRRCGWVIENLTLAYQVGDLEYLPKEVELP
ncbi:MAG TPA: hypothetical protein VIL12_06500 [Acidimicrobiia bacterium]